MSTDERRHAVGPRAVDSHAVESRPTVALPDFLTRAPAARPAPLRDYRHLVVTADVLVVTGAVAIGYLIHGVDPAEDRSAFAAYRLLAVALVGLWLAALYVRGCYDDRHLGVGPDEFDRLLTATILLFAVVAGLGYFLDTTVSRAYVFVSLPVGLLALVAERWLLRRVLYRRRAQGRACYRTVVVGSPDRVAALSADLDTDAYAGFRVVATHGPPQAGDLDSWTAALAELVAATDADAVAVTPSRRIDAEAVRRLSWALEGNGIDLLVAPALSDVAGPRITMRPAAGVPLIHLDEPGLSSAQRLAKRALDLVGAVLALAVLAVPMGVVALAVRASSPGPVLFRQWRVGQGGRTFRILKFRTMVDGADAARDDLRAAAGHDSPAFKPVDDPRITRTGRFLRRWSIDEWPQLVNVVRGEMSLVGPRPHPIDDVARYGRHDYRRLLAKPGITGLWQVAGRSDLGWPEAIRLDLHYVENWSMTRDLILILRTVRVVVTGAGAR